MSEEESTTARGFSYDQLTTTYHWPVVVEMPQDGEFEEFEFTAEFRMVSQDEAQAIYDQVRTKLQAQIEDKNGPSMIPTNAVVKEFLVEVWVGWDNRLKGTNGVQMKATKANKRKWLAWSPMMRAIDKAYRESARGQEAVKEN